VGVPWRVAFALQRDGWWLRSDIIWAKENPTPESVKDRPTSSHEHIFLLAKSKRYWYDSKAIREEAEYPDDKRKPYVPGQVDGRGNGHDRGGGTKNYIKTEGRNKRDVWSVSTKPFPGAHFAVYPEDLIEPCIEAGCPEKVCKECGTPWEREIEKEKVGDNTDKRKHNPRKGIRGANLARPPQGASYTGKTVGWAPGCECSTGETEPGVVLDPFAGTGTTCKVAKDLGRDFVGIELVDKYVAMAQKRIGLYVDNPELLDNPEEPLRNFTEKEER